MNPALTICRYELRMSLRSYIPWLIYAITVSIIGLLFVSAMRSMSGDYEHLPAIFCEQLLLVMCLPVSLFTMRLFAEERESGTLEILMTAPVTDAQVVVGKFMSAFILTCISIALSCLIMVGYKKMAQPPYPYSPLSFCGGLSLVFIAAMTWCAIGTFISIMSKHYIFSAAVTSIVVFITAVMFSGNHLELNIFLNVDFIDILDFARGIADTRVIFVAFSVTVYMLFCSIRLLESRRWVAL